MIFIILAFAVGGAIFFIINSKKSSSNIEKTEVDNLNTGIGPEMMLNLNDDKEIHIDTDNNSDEEIIDLNYTLNNTESAPKNNDTENLDNLKENNSNKIIENPSFKNGQFKNFMEMTSDEFRAMINYENNEINNNIMNSNKDIDMSLVVGKYEILKRMKEIRDNTLDKEFEIKRVKLEHKSEEQRQTYLTKIRLLMLLSRHNPIGLSIEEIRDKDDELGRLSIQKLSIMLKNLISNCNIQKYSTPVDTFFVYVNSIGYDFSMIKEPVWEVEESTKNEENLGSLEVIELLDLKEEHFFDGGIIKQNIHYYLNKYLNLKTKSNLSTANLNTMLNELYKDITSMIKFDDYKRVISTSDVNINLVKGIYLYNLKEFLLEFDGNDYDGYVNLYTNIINNIHKNLFMPEDQITKSSIIESLGMLKNKLNVDFNTEDINYQNEDSKYIKKAIAIDFVVKAIFKVKDQNNIFYASKLNAIKFLSYISEGVVFFRDDQIEFDGSKREALGLEFNSSSIWINPEILLDVNTFIREALDLIDFIEEDDKFKINLADIDEEIRGYFNDEHITAYSFLSLFINKYAEFNIIDGFNGFEIKVNEYLKEKFPDINNYLEQLIKVIADFNKLPIENKEVNFL